MSVTIKIAPPELCLSRNQIPLKLETPDAFVTEGKKGDYQITFTNKPALGNSLEFFWQFMDIEYNLTFTFAAANDPEENEIKAYTGSTTEQYEEWINEILIPGLLAHPDMFEYFQIGMHIAGANRGIRLAAKVDGDLIFVVLAYGINLNELLLEGAIAEAIENYKARIIVSIAPTANAQQNEYLQLPEIQGFPNRKNEIDINLQPLIEPYFKESELPSLPMDNYIEKINSAPRKVRVAISQQKGEPLKKDYFSFISFSVLPGGVNTYDWVTMRNNLKAWLTADENGKRRFLTNRKTQRIYPNQPQYLHWYFVGDPDQRMRIKPKSGTHIDVFSQSGLMVIDNIYRAPIGTINYPNTDIAKSKHYDITIGAPLLGEFFKFFETINVITMPAVTALTIIEYQNQWGVPETIALPWELQRVAAIAKDEYERVLPLNYNITERARITLGELYTDSFELTIQANDRIDGPHIPEIAMSPETYIIIDGTIRIPCTIEAGNINLENMSRSGTQFPQQRLRITLDRQISYSRIMNITNFCK